MELEENNVCASFFPTTFVYKQLTTHLNLVLRLKMSEAIPLILLYTFTA
jgi:hypothetical protein